MKRRIVDLTLNVHDGIRGLETEQRTQIASDGYNTTDLHLYSHTGTHMDAPLHFIEGGATIDEVDLAVCLGRATVIDVTHIAPDGQLQVDDLGAAANDVSSGARLLLRSDWSHHVDLPDFRSMMPRISPALARWFVEKRVALIGVETPSVASVNEGFLPELIEVHQTLLGGGVTIVEGLVHLDQLHHTEVDFIVLPLKIRGCDGSPVRAIAVE